MEYIVSALIWLFWGGCGSLLHKEWWTTPNPKNGMILEWGKRQKIYSSVCVLLGFIWFIMNVFLVVSDRIQGRK